MRLKYVCLGLLVVVCGGNACSASEGGSAGPPKLGNPGGASGAGTGGSSASSSDGGAGKSGSAGSSGSGGTGFIVDSGMGGSAPGTGGSAGSATGGAGGSGACTQVPPDKAAPKDVCGDGLDNDLNGFVDESCPCNLAQTQPCFGGYPSQATDPVCTKGIQTCKGSTEFHSWGPCEGWKCGQVPPPQEICDNMKDDDCDNLIDEGCALTAEVNLNGDCLFAACPQQAPYPIGCRNLVLEGGDSRGCVAVLNDGSGRVYFQEGDACCLPPPLNFDCGNVRGTLLCSSKPGPGLNDTNCPINKQQKIYPPPNNNGPKYGCP